jgi:hypothetical protein
MNRLVRGLKGQADQGGAVDGGAQSQLKGPGGLWGFLRDKRNQQVLSWIGGGLVVAVTGLWVAFVYFFPAPKSPETKSAEPMPPSVQADCGGVAIVGPVTGATITGGTITASDCAPKSR